MELRSDGVVHLFWLPGRIVDATDALATVGAVDRMSPGGEYPLLIDVSKAEAVHHEARTILTRPWSGSRVALLGSSPADKFVATLLLRAGTPLHPARFFTSKTDALNWLPLGHAKSTAG